MNPTLLLAMGMLGLGGCDGENKDTDKTETGNVDTGDTVDSAETGDSSIFDTSETGDTSDTYDTADTADTADTGTAYADTCYINGANKWAACAADLLDACANGATFETFTAEITESTFDTIEYNSDDFSGCVGEFDVTASNPSIELSASTDGDYAVKVDGGSWSVPTNVTGFHIVGNNGVQVTSGGAISTTDMIFENTDIAVNATGDGSVYEGNGDTIMLSTQTAYNFDDGAYATIADSIVYNSEGDYGVYAANASALEISGLAAFENEFTGSVVLTQDVGLAQLAGMWIFNNETNDATISIDPTWDPSSGSYSYLQSSLVANNITAAESVILINDEGDTSESFEFVNNTIVNNTSSNGAMDTVIDLSGAVNGEYNITLENIDISNNADVTGSTTVNGSEYAVFEFSNLYQNGLEDLSETPTETIVSVDPQYASGDTIFNTDGFALDVYAYDLAGENLVEQGNPASAYRSYDGTRADISFLDGAYGYIAEGMKTTLEDFVSTL